MELNEKQLNLIEKVIARGRTSKLVKWRLQNFAQYIDETFSFNDDGVVVLKGYNSAGKTNALKGLQACLTTAYAGSGKHRKLINWDSLTATVSVFFDDGVEIVYELIKSSHAEKAKVSNAYYMYLNKGDKRILLYDTLVNGRPILVKQTPDIIKRYLNLAEIGGAYLNVMRKSEKSVLLSQTPRAMMKYLSHVTGTQSSEQAIKQIISDNKETLSEIRGSDFKVKLYEEEILERRNVNEFVVDLLEQLDLEVGSLDDNLGVIFKAVDSLKSIGSLTLGVSIDEVSTSELESSVKLENSLESLSKVTILPKLDEVSQKELEQALQTEELLNSLKTVSKTMVELPEIDLEATTTATSIHEKLDNLGSRSIEIKCLDRASEELTSELQHLNNLNSVSDLETLLDKSVDHGSKIGKYTSLLEGLEKEAQEHLEELKNLGYPVSKCLTCGALTITEEFQVSDLGLNGISHEH